MGTTYYYEEDGMMIGESTNGVMRNYITDALGSVVGTALNGVAENTYKFTPYGGILDRTGTAADPSFLWNGGSGYRATKLPNADYYVRRRIVSSSSGQWTTVDPLWPHQRPFNYAGSRPVSVADPSGLWMSTCCSRKRTVSQNFQSSAGEGWGKTDIYSTIYWEVQKASKNQSWGPVSIKWEEKSNVLPQFYTGSVNTWIDVSHVANAAPPFPTLATDQAKCLGSGHCPVNACNGNSSDFDPPMYNYGEDKPLIRCLCFRLTVFSKCNSQATVYPWSQTVSFQFAPWSLIALVFAPSEPITDAQYCSQPDGVPCPQTPR